MKQTLAQVTLPTIENPIEFFSVVVGLIVLIALLVQLFRSRNISPYQGMPALGTFLVMLVLLAGGSVVDLTQLPKVVATTMGFIVEVVSSGFLWPFIITALIAHAIKVVNISTSNKFFPVGYSER